MARIEWFGNKKETHRKIVRGVPGIKATVREKAELIESAATAILAPHHARNAPHRDPEDSISSLSVESGIVDSYVVLTDEDGGAAAIEYYIGPMKKGARIVAGGG